MSVMGVTKCFAAIFLVVVSSVVAFMQESKGIGEENSNNTGCRIVAPNYSAQYIGFEKETKDTSVFKFVNNSTCSVIVIVGDPCTLKLVKQSNGTFIHECPPTKSGDIVRISYFVIKNDGKHSFKEHKLGDIIVPLTLKKSEYVLFAVRKEDIRESQVAVKFFYSWDFKENFHTRLGSNSPDHLVYSEIIEK